MAWSLIAVALSTFGASVLAPFAFRPLLGRWGVVDAPSARSSHSTPTLRAGGLAPLTGWVLGMLAVMFLLPHDVPTLIIVGAAAVSLAALGFLDDLHDLPATPRLGAQVLIGATTSIAATLATGISAWWVAVPIGTVLIVGYVNAANFMDGINGLSGLHGAVVGLAFAWFGLLTGTIWLTYVGAVIAVTFAAFLPWNLHKSGLFLGDIGSYLLGGSIAVAATLALGSGVPALLVLSPLSVYIADTVVTMLRRLLRGEQVMSAHRTHTYQRLTDAGLSHFAAALVVTASAAVTTLIGVITWSNGVGDWLGWLLITVVCGLYLSVPRWRGSRRLSIMLDVPPAAEIREIIASPGHIARRWAVLGSSGFVGSAVVGELRARGLEVVELAAPRLRFDSTLAADLDALLAATDSEPEAAALATKLSGVDIVVNAAGLAKPDSVGDGDLYGANALLPIVIASACATAGVRRYIHLSSAAVQGRTPRIDASSDVAPFSPYSHSKALGERGLLALSDRGENARTVILRATSVQGVGRPTTEALTKLARSPLASVAAPGTAPSVVSSVANLALTVVDLGSTTSPVPGIVLQPWEGLTTRRVMELASGGRTPVIVAASVCRFLIVVGFKCSRLVPKVTGAVRRAEMMWFGQDQQAGWGQAPGAGESNALRRVFSGGGHAKGQMTSPTSI